MRTFRLVVNDVAIFCSSMGTTYCLLSGMYLMATMNLILLCLNVFLRTRIPKDV